MTADLPPLRARLAHAHGETLRDRACMAKNRRSGRSGALTSATSAWTLVKRHSRVMWWLAHRGGGQDELRPHHGVPRRRPGLHLHPCRRQHRQHRVPRRRSLRRLDATLGPSALATAFLAYTHPTTATSSPARGTSTEVSTASAKRRTTSATCAPPTTSTCRTITPPGDPGPTATSARTTATVNIGSGRAKLVVLPAYRLRPWALCALCRTSWQPWAWARVGPGPAEPLRDGRRDFGVVQGTCRDP
mmetsp:Transcript_40222/g.129201  ORF Transcript_40222/g.129201 Transcript_40222/m.129201 type:complete len:246 (+) Transcript_40222:464-1201(+)